MYIGTHTTLRNSITRMAISQLRQELPEYRVGQNQHRRITNLSRTLDLLARDFRYVQRHDLAPFVHWNPDAPIHRWFRYREAYSPDLIDRLRLGQRILDPFCGCGSIMVGAAQRGRRSIGIDVNPVAVFAAKVKLSPLSPKQTAMIQLYMENIEQFGKTSSRWPMPALSIAEKVFEPKILATLQKLRRSIEEFSNEDQAVRNFLLLGWLGILEAVGSYFKEGNGIKYRNKKRQKGTYEDRPEGKWQLDRFGADQRRFVLNAYRNQLSLMLSETTQWDIGTWRKQTVLAGSAMNLDRLCGRNSFDSIVFSPPYANRFDYFESFKVELWFGGFVSTYEELNNLRKTSLRSHLAADYCQPAVAADGLEDLIDLMDRDASSWRMGVADLLRGYFHDLREVLTKCRYVAPNARCNVVVGNSAFAGVIIPSDVLTASIGIQAGYKKATIVEARHLTVAPQQRAMLKGFERYMRESVVVLE